ncbi:hypothetical protein EV651_13414 [Kribbella sp. VKM Ac-2571]|nr:hypothetical protein EV651_13414 [Kribbella sp. VKM Ac-2571]
MDAIVEIPEPADVPSIELICQPDLIPFCSRGRSRTEWTARY